MKRFIVSLVILISIFISTNVHAQSKNIDPQIKAEKEMKMLKEAIPGLSIEQEEQIQKIEDEWVQKVEALSNKYSNAKDAKNEYKTLKKEKNSKILAVLTKEQKDQLRVFKNEHK